jgi:hypothetical protein
MTAIPLDPLRLAIDARRRELRLTCLDLDYEANLPSGYTSKFLCGVRNLGPGALGKVLHVLGVEIALVPEGMLASARSFSTGSHQKIRAIAAAGGKARREALSPEARSAIAQKAATTRWSKYKWKLKVNAGMRARFKRGPRGKARLWAMKMLEARQFFDPALMVYSGFLAAKPSTDRK